MKPALIQGPTLGAKQYIAKELKDMDVDGKHLAWQLYRLNKRQIFNPNYQKLAEQTVQTIRNAIKNPSSFQNLKSSIWVFQQLSKPYLEISDQKLKELGDKLDISQKDVAEACNIHLDFSHATRLVEKMSTLKITPNQETIEELSQLLMCGAKHVSSPKLERDVLKFAEVFSARFGGQLTFATNQDAYESIAFGLKTTQHPRFEELSREIMAKFHG